MDSKFVVSYYGIFAFRWVLYFVVFNEARNQRKLALHE